MELKEIIDGLNQDPKKLVEDIKSTKSAFTDTYDKAKTQIDPKLHTVITDKCTRPDKTITVDNGTKVVPVARLAIPLQKQIVNRAAAFLCGNPIEIDATTDKGSIEEKLIQVIKKAWDDNKLDYESKRLAKLMMSETEVAELWYLEEADPAYWKGTPNETPSVKLRLRMKILANKYGDKLYPIFNDYDDMVAFARGYTVNVENKDIEHLDIYTPETTYLGVASDTGFTFTPEDNVAKKIPVIYYNQEQTEWADVQTLIDRLEVMISKMADTNDYFGHPTLILEAENEGDVEWAQKDEAGKAAILKNNAKASYLTWNQSPESAKLELLNLRSLIMDMTDTPDISFDQVKGLGNYSGIALKMLFLGAHMKASDKEESFGKGIQRRLNFLKAAMAIVNTTFEPALPLSIKPRFKYFLPKNELEETQVLDNAISGGFLSEDTAIDLFSMVEDKQAEKDKIQAQKDAAATNPATLDQLFGGNPANPPKPGNPANPTNPQKPVPPVPPVKKPAKPVPIIIK